MDDKLRPMRHQHTLCEKDTSLTECPNFSLVFTFFRHPRSLEQAVNTAKKHAHNKNHEYICVADNADQVIHPHFPPLKLMEEMQPSGYLLNPEHPKTLQEQELTTKYCMDKYSDIEYVDLFDYLKGYRTVDGFKWRINSPMVNARPGRGNFYLGYNLGAYLAKNDIIMQMVNDDMMFTPDWDLKIWQAFSKVDHTDHTCVPVAYQGFFQEHQITTKDILCGPGAEPRYYIKRNNTHDDNAAYIYERDFLKTTKEIENKLKGFYLIEGQYHRHYGYMGFMLMHKDLFFKYDGYSMKGWPKASQDIVFDGELGNAGVRKVVVLDTITMHERIHYIEEETKKILVGEE